MLYIYYDALCLYMSIKYKIYIYVGLLKKNIFLKNVI